MILSMSLVFALCFISGSCTQYNPSLYTGYDVLNPGPEVTMNPIGTTEDGNFEVNKFFIMWVDELQTEIIKLRKLRKP